LVATRREAGIGGLVGRLLTMVTGSLTCGNPLTKLDLGRYRRPRARSSGRSAGCDRAAGPWWICAASGTPPAIMDMEGGNRNFSRYVGYSEPDAPALR
jgi:hypothetical protein